MDRIKSVTAKSVMPDLLEALNEQKTYLAHAYAQTTLYHAINHLLDRNEDAEEIDLEACWKIFVLLKTICLEMSKYLVSHELR